MEKVCCIFCMMWFRSIWANYISIAKFKQRANHASKVKNFCYKITLNPVQQTTKELILNDSDS